jgi:hypothetical protein
MDSYDVHVHPIQFQLYNKESFKHFFLDCPIYIQASTILIGNINRVTTCYTLDIEFLTCGNDNLTYEHNCITTYNISNFVFLK